MNETTGEPEGATECDDAIPNVTQIPLLRLAFQDDRVLDAAVRRLIEDVVDQRDITAAFGNIP